MYLDYTNHTKHAYHAFHSYTMPNIIDAPNLQPCVAARRRAAEFHCSKPLSTGSEHLPPRYLLRGQPVAGLEDSANIIYTVHSANGNGYQINRE